MRIRPPCVPTYHEAALVYAMKSVLKIAAIAFSLTLPQLLAENTPPAQLASPLAPQLDYESFLSQHDMIWDRIPRRWEIAPYTGNGNIGFLFYQAKGSAKNVISLHAGRHDYYDHRLPDNGSAHTWIYRCRLPLGRFDLQSKGDITGADLRLDLWNAELRGTITTTLGSYKINALTHSTSDLIYCSTEAQNGESVTVTWQAEEPYSSVRKTLEAGGGPKGGSWDAMRKAPYPRAPQPELSQQGKLHFSLQKLYQHRGETCTGWELCGDPASSQILLASIDHSFPEKNSLGSVKKNLLQGQKQLIDQSLLRTHRQWWHHYYPQSFLTLNDPEKEAFYWIQMYKLGSAMREDGPILDLMGPWYHSTFWPMVWGDLNVQLIYWTHLTANRMSLGESLPNNLDKYADNLAKNVPARWKDSAAIAACFPQDCLAYDSGKAPDMLAWVLHDYWLHCTYAADHDRLRDKFFPLLRQTMNGYLNFLKDRKVDITEQPFSLPKTWSPEYPAPWDENCNFTIALLRWSAQTLLDLNQKHRINDPLASQWQLITDNLVDFQKDENGLRIAKNTPFDKPHRHYSHLLAYYPLAVLTPESEKGAALLKSSLDHWLKVSMGDIKVKAMPVTGYTATGAASMYAMLGDAETAYHYLDFLIQHKNVSSTTMYAEGNPVIESPLSFATSLHDMLLQSWGGKIRVFPACPNIWPDAAFHHLRTQGAFLVSARKKTGVTRFVRIESLAGSPCTIITDIPKPHIAINGLPATAGQFTKNSDSSYTIALKKGDYATFTPVPLDESDLTIAPNPVAKKDRNLFGFSEKTTRLPGHAFYSK